MITLRGKRALVTGGTRGIGAATSRILAACGADVAMLYRSRRAEAEAMKVDVEARDVRALVVSADLANVGAVDTAVKQVADAWGGIDVFVGNAGVWPAEEVPVDAMDDARWLNTMRENIDGMFYSTRAALRVMPDGGRIVLVSSTAGQRGESLHADYATSKGAMIAFVKSLAIEVAGRGITVNSVAPGWVDTEMCEQPYAGDGRARISAAIPVGRIATPDDIAGPIVFLCSEQARHITGEILNVNGGSVLCG